MNTLQQDITSKECNQSKIKISNDKLYLICKRTLDILGALFGFVILSWLFIIVCILIKLEDPKGSIIFSQDRVGMNGKIIRMYKFRSMTSNAEEIIKTLYDKNEASGPMFKMKNDPRVTKIGKIIRRTSIDELPQLWNVLKGDMSLVGPRPPLIREVEQYSTYDRYRLLVKPGCTGYWQVGGRNNLSFSQMVELDLKYIATRNIWIDIIIIIKTFKVMIVPSGS